jgi:hypothetical protein
MAKLEQPRKPESASVRQKLATLQPLIAWGSRHGLLQLLQYSLCKTFVAPPPCQFKQPSTLIGKIQSSHPMLNTLPKIAWVSICLLEA